MNLRLSVPLLSVFPDMIYDQYQSARENAMEPELVPVGSGGAERQQFSRNWHNAESNSRTNATVLAVAPSAL